MYIYVHVILQILHQSRSCMYILDLMLKVNLGAFYPVHVRSHCDGCSTYFTFLFQGFLQYGVPATPEKLLALMNKVRPAQNSSS